MSSRQKIDDCKTLHNMGNRASKRNFEEEKIVDNVTSRLKNGFTSSGMGLVAKAIADFSSVLSSFLHP